MNSLSNNSKPFILWQLYFPRVFRDNGGFDVAIGNPPYISAANQIANEELFRNREIIINSNKYHTLYSKWDLYIPFLELGMKLIRNSAIMTMIVPYPLTNQIYAKKTRQMFMEEYNMIQISDLKEVKVFEATVQNCIPFVKKEKPTPETIISRMHEKAIRHEYVQPYNKMLLDKETLVWNLTEDELLISKYSDMHTLGEYCYVSKGMVLNADEKKAKGEFKKKDLISETKDDIHCKMYIEGKDIEPFLIKRIRFLEWNTQRSPSKLSRPTFEELYTNEKLLFNCLGELQVAIDEIGDIYCEQAIRVCVPWHKLKAIHNKSIDGVVKKYSTIERDEMERLSEKVELKYLLGILNSKIGHELLTSIRGGDYHIVPEHIRNIPIPLANNEKQKQIEELVNAIIEKKKNNIEVENEIAQIDEIVYELYAEGEKR